MPLHRIRAADAYRNMHENLYAKWPRRDDPDNRFEHLADPAFRSGFLLEPGQRIFTIGSCFARHIERVLASRGFEIPTLDFTMDKREWAGDPTAVLNNYVPGAIAPQIRWAFGHEQFDIARHGAEVRPGRHVDLQLGSRFRPTPAAAVVARREQINAIYRKLAESHVVLITLGLIEAWFDNKSGLYINAAPPKSVVDADPHRLELHVLEYNDVLSELRKLVVLLDEVCPRDYRMIVTVSPVPLGATFTTSDVAVANTYSKSVLRAAAEAIVAERDHVEYFPSYESVMLTERARAFGDDQIHVTDEIVKFNVERMIRRYVRSAAEPAPAEIVAQAREEQKAGRRGTALKHLQAAWAKLPDDPELTVALGEALLQAGAGANAEGLLTKYLATHSDAAAHVLLAGYYNGRGRYDEAALHAEKAARLGKTRLRAALERATAYYYLRRYDEGLALLNRLKLAAESKPSVIYWKARFCEKLERPVEAEELYRRCISFGDRATFLLAYAEFLFGQKRWTDALEWVDRILLVAPENVDALKLRTEIADCSGQKLPPAPRSEPMPLKLLQRLVRFR